MLEIGPGRGAITDLLLKKLSVLNVVEIDRDLSHELTQHYGDKINLFNTDILDFDLNQLDLNTHSKIRVIGNLPYNISTPILFHLFVQIDLIQDMLFMLPVK